MISGFTDLPIVLTADRLLMADYPILLDGMTAASQTTATPEWLMRHFVAPPMPVVGGRVAKAPLGLRLLEAALLEAGFAAAEVGIVPPERLSASIGPRTRVVIVSSGDPLGLGMNNSTMAGIAGGAPYTPLWLEQMCGELQRIKQRHGQFKVLLGGPGAWQVEQSPSARQRLGIDTVLCGYAEQAIVQVTRQIFAGQSLEPIQKAPADISLSIPAVRGPTSMGVVEISRGCGLGCSFCTIRSQPMQHLPVQKIVQDVRTNVEGGMKSVCLISEDFLRYGAENGTLNPARILEMVRAVRQVPGLRLIQLDHLNVSSVARCSAADLRAIHDALVAGVRHEYLWVNLGVETASGALLAASACRGKLHPFAAEDWKRICAETIEKLIAAGFTPMVSLVFGLPGETQEHLAQTLELIRAFRDQRLTVFPLFYAPIDPATKSFGVTDMTPLHWELFGLCYQISFRWMPHMFWDNQRGAGVPWWRRSAIQVGGFFRMRDWRFRIWRKARRARK